MRQLNTEVIAFQATASIVIAILTTVITTVATSYLLARPWCIQLEPGLHQRIVYGSSKCSSDSSVPHQRYAAQEIRNVVKGSEPKSR